MLYRKGLLPTAVLACGVSGVIGTAQAAEWLLEPRLQVGYENDDNYRLDLPGSEVSVSGAAADALLKMSLATPLSEVLLQPRLRHTWFPDDPAEESTDGYFLMDLKNRGQKSQVFLRGTYANEIVARSEQPTLDPGAGLGETGSSDAGRVTQRNRREFVRLEPGMSHEITERSRFEVTGNYSDVSFDDTLPDVQVGYRELGGRAGFGFALSPTLDWQVRAFGARYELDAIETDADAIGLETQWTRTWADKAQGYVRIGAQQTTFSDNGLGSGDDATSYLAGAGARWPGPRSEVLLDATRSVGPSASGFVVARDQLRLKLTRLFGPKFSVYLSGLGIHDQAVADNTGMAERNYVTAQAGFTWRLQQRVSLLAFYDHAWQEFDGDPSDARSRMVSVSFVFEPRRRN